MSDTELIKRDMGITFFAFGMTWFPAALLFGIYGIQQLYDIDHLTHVPALAAYIDVYALRGASHILICAVMLAVGLVRFLRVAFAQPLSNGASA